MSHYSEITLELSQGVEFIRGSSSDYGDYAKYSFYTRGKGSSTTRRPVTTRPYFLSSIAEQKFVEQLSAFIDLTASGACFRTSALQPSSKPITTAAELKTQLGWEKYEAEPLEVSGQGLQTYLTVSAKKMPRLILAHTYGPMVGAEALRASATTIFPQDARQLSDVLTTALALHKRPV